MIHVVKKGETLTTIAQQYGISPTLLRYENMLDQPDRLVIGQTLLVLIPEQVHTVQAGDTLAMIAQRHALTMRHIYRLNPWLNGMTEIYPGQTIVLQYSERPQQAKIIGGYSYPYIDNTLLRGVLPYLSALLPFTYGFTSEGQLTQIDDGEMLLMSREMGTGTVMVLAPMSPEGIFNNNLITDVLNNPAKRQRLIQEVLANVLRKGYHGVDLDFEYVRRDDGPAFVSFAAELGLELHRINRFISAALAPKTYAEQQGLLYEGHDYRMLGQVLDFTLLMTYEWGYTYGPPLAVAPIYEVRRVLEYGLSEIPANKVLMGIPNYGYDWTLPYQEGGMARSISNLRAVELAWIYGAEIFYDEAAQAPFFNYTTPEGAEHMVWFEDLRSMRAKFDLCAELGLRGLTYWTVTRPFPANFLQQATIFYAEEINNLTAIEPFVPML